MHLPAASLFVALFCLSACGDIEVRSTPPTQTISSALKGRWVGSWQSSDGVGVGTLTLRIQEFDAQPVVSLEIDNPCLQPQSYELAFIGSGLMLLTNGIPVMEAVVSGSGQLVGTYACDLDQGVWTVDRTAMLPEISDLGGAWEGEVTVDGVAVQPIRLEIFQTVQSGVVELLGEAYLAGVLPFGVAIEGQAYFDEMGLQVLLETALGVVPSFALNAVGDIDPQQLSGVLTLLPGTSIFPFTQAVVELNRL